jgi:hypothetical protein
MKASLMMTRRFGKDKLAVVPATLGVITTKTNSRKIFFVMVADVIAQTHPHERIRSLYARTTSIFGDITSSTLMPPWLTITSSLQMKGSLRGQIKHHNLL